MSVARLKAKVFPPANPEGFDPDMEPEFRAIFSRCKEATMTSLPRMYALYCAVNYVIDRSVPGAIVECGVWKGGSSMLAAMTLARRGHTSRDLYMYDTYAGMTSPSPLDHQLRDEGLGSPKAVRDEWHRTQRLGVSAWCFSPLDEVKENLRLTGYPYSRMKFIEGPVEETIPATTPEAISILRLDTDWYESTLHELRHLYPRLSRHGVLILDDYGYWGGAKRAVDTYFDGQPVLMTKLDVAARLIIKLDADE